MPLRGESQLFFKQSVMKDLTCIETGRPIIGLGDMPLAVSAPTSNAFEPLSRKIVDETIPPEKRRELISDLQDLGIDVYYATAEMRSDGSHDPDTFSCGKFAFSVSAEDCKELLPEVFGTFFPLDTLERLERRNKKAVA